MAVTVPLYVKKCLYGAFFVSAVPVLMFQWALNTSHLQLLPLAPSPNLGLTLLAAGLLLMIEAMRELWVHGRGLPMNFAPPAEYVSRGVFLLTPHPIYAGFCLCSLGLSLFTGSKSGFWLVTPVAVLCCAALVLGYERIDLARRFGSLLDATRLLPPSQDSAPTAIERLRVFIHAFVPWGLLYGTIILRGVPQDALDPYFPWEKSFPVWEWTEPVYASAYPVALAAPFVAASRRLLRGFLVSGWSSMGVSFLTFIVLPVSAEPRYFEPQSWFGRALMLERSLDTPAAAFPSFHVIWAILAGVLWGASFPRWRVLWVAWIMAVTASCVTTGMHAVVDLAAAFVVCWAALSLGKIWRNCLRLAERIANSWSALRVGPFRMINHSLYAGLAGLLGTLVGLSVCGPENAAAFLLIICLGVLGAALWAQFVESASGLQRPFGYYGFVLGAAVGIAASWVSSASAPTLAAAFAVGAPWTQAIGRLRCLAQGCCHGSPCSPEVGITHVNRMSRVVARAGWAGVPLYPTPLYSLAWNVVAGLILLRLYVAGSEPLLLAGAYLILNGAGRFVEEAYRGEPQTRVVAGLRLYQWLAIASIVTGAALTCVEVPGRLPPPAFHLWYAGYAAAIAVVCALLMGVDFPESTKRFARLT